MSKAKTLKSSDTTEEKSHGASSTVPNGCVPGNARLLTGDARYLDTGIGQSPHPARWRRRVAEGKVCSVMNRLKEAGSKSVGRRTGMPRAGNGGGQADEAWEGRDESATQDKVLYPSNG